MIKSVTLKNFLINTVFKGVSGLNGICRKNQNKILIYSDIEFRDNSRYLYEYLLENGYNRKYRIICAVKDFEKYRDGAPEGVTFTGPAGGIREYLTSGHVFYSFGKLPIVPGRGQKVIQMWHGTSFKGFAENQKKTNDYRHVFYTHVYASSDYFVPIVARKFSVPESVVCVCGHPRTDSLFADKPVYQLGSYKKVILWLPTFRKSSYLGMSDGKADEIIPIVRDSELKLLDEFLIAENVRLIVKLHPAQDITAISHMQFTNLSLMTHDQFTRSGYDLYALLRHADALITDYSSVFYDYLLLDRQIGFTEDDVNEYRSSRGFAVDDPDAFRPGEKISTFLQLKSFIRNVAQDEDGYRDQRKRICDLANKYQDGNNCRRTLEISGIEL